MNRVAYQDGKSITCQDDNTQYLKKSSFEYQL